MPYITEVLLLSLKLFKLFERSGRTIRFYSGGLFPLLKWYYIRYCLGSIVLIGYFLFYFKFYLLVRGITS